MEKQTTAVATGGTRNPDAATEQRRTTSVYLTVELLEELDAIARRLRVSRTWLIEDLVRRGLGKYQDK